MSSWDSTDAPQWMTALRRVGRLTGREREVFALLAEGPTNMEIAREIFVTERTVRAHIMSIQAKLGLRTRLKVCLAAAAYAQGLSQTTAGGAGIFEQDGCRRQWPEHAEGVIAMKKPYPAPKLTARGAFAAATAGFGKFKADQLVGRLIP
ncbi:MULTISPECIES: helix-turn-helix transcriptional regulator [unclassified Streptomyces]|uniref:helix-turn-helix domain-containing protein n=1 Tax=unclassified Streptomyces TaxID=2593676 RepID=UPI003408CE26